MTNTMTTDDWLRATQGWTISAADVPEPLHTALLAQSLREYCDIWLALAQYDAAPPAGEVNAHD